MAYGPAAFVAPAVLIVLSGSVAGNVSVGTLRRYFRNLDIMKQQLLSISFDTASSTCCNSNHRSPSGEPVIFDRKLVKECVNAWLGSQEAYENSVR